MKLVYSDRFKKDLKVLDPDTVKRVESKLLEYQNGFSSSFPLRNEFKGLDKLVIGKYRVFLRKRDVDTVEIVTIRKRDKAYRKAA